MSKKMLFENNDLDIKKIKQDVFFMKNFYKNPDDIVNYLSQHKPVLHKANDSNSLNNKFFTDKRHLIKNQDVIPTETNLITYFKRYSKPKGYVATNIFKMLDKNFNDYKNNYWQPHKDKNDFVCIIYFNNPGCDGTNLYEDSSFKSKKNEHEEPWVHKKNFKLSYTYKPEFNDIFIFSGDILHGMNIASDRFFYESRINQVFFI